jgi:hypothetical protein
MTPLFMATLDVHPIYEFTVAAPIMNEHANQRHCSSTDYG